MVPCNFRNNQYGNYLRIQTGSYQYKIYFYEGSNVVIGGIVYNFSCKNMFPLSIAKNKESFCEIIKEAISPLNQFELGISFEFNGYDMTEEYGFEFKRKDGVNAIVIYNDFIHGGLGGFFPDKKEIGFSVRVSKNDSKNFIIGRVRHEILHCLGFGHKGTSETIFSHTQLMSYPVITGLQWQEGYPYEFSEDSIHGLDTVYGTKTKFHVSGSIRNRAKYSNAEAFLVKWHADLNKRCILYQSPIDSTGYFEFNLRQKYGLQNGFKIICVGKTVEGYSWNDLSRQSLQKFRWWNRSINYNNIILDTASKTNNIESILL